MISNQKGDSRNVHRLQLLEQQLRSVRNVDLRDLRAIPAHRAMKLLLLQVGNRHKAAL